jgi:hypothetical protein
MQMVTSGKSARGRASMSPSDPLTLVAAELTHRLAGNRYMNGLVDKTTFEK